MTPDQITDTTILIEPSAGEQKPLYKDIPSGDILRDFSLISEKNTPEPTEIMYEEDNKIQIYNRGAWILSLDNGFNLEKIDTFTRQVKNFLLVCYMKEGRKEKITFNIAEFFVDYKENEWSRTQKKNFIDSLKVLRHCGFDTMHTASNSYHAAGSSFITDYEVYGDNSVELTFGSKFKKYVLDRAPRAVFPLRAFLLNPHDDRLACQIVDYLYPLASQRYEGTEEEQKTLDPNYKKQLDYITIQTLLDNIDIPPRSKFSSPSKQAERIIEPLFKALFTLSKPGKEILFFDLLDPKTKKPLTDKQYYSVVPVPREHLDKLKATPNGEDIIKEIYPGRENYPDTSLFFQCYFKFSFFDYENSGMSSRKKRRERRAELYEKNITKANKKKKASKKEN